MNKKLIAPIVTAAVMLATSVGTTFALFTSEDEANIAITSGNVDILAKIGDLKTYSGEWNEETETYDILERTDDEFGTFYDGGFAKINGSLLTLDRMCPLDKVTFNISVKNESNISVKYKTSIKCISGPILYSVLDKTLTTKVGETETSEVLTAYEDHTAWTTLEPGSDGATVGVAIEFKDHGDLDNPYKDLSTKIEFSVEAVQANAHVVDVASEKYAFDKVSADVTESISTKVDELGQEVVDNTLLANEDKTASVVVPSQAKTEGTETALDINSTLNLKVEEKEEPESTFTIKETDVAIPYEIDVTKVTTVGTETTSEKLKGTEDVLFEVNLFVGKGLTDVRVFHKNVALTEISNLDAAKVDQTFAYNKLTGDVTIWTSSFSEYTVVYDNIPFIEEGLLSQGYVARIGTDGYSSLVDAFNNQKDGETVVLMTDVTGQDVTWQKLIKGNYSFDLEGHTMSGVEAYYARPTLQLNMLEGSSARIFDSTENPGTIRGYRTSYPEIDQSGNHIHGVVYLKGHSNYTSHIDVVIEDITIQAEPNMSAITNNIASSKQSLEVKSGSINGDIVLDLKGGGDVEVKVLSEVTLNGKVNYIAETTGHKVESNLNEDGSTTYKTVVSYDDCDLLLTNKATTQGADLNVWTSSSTTSFSFSMGNSATKYHDVKVCRDIDGSNNFSFDITTIDPVTLDLNGKTITGRNYTTFKCTKDASRSINVVDSVGGAHFNEGLNSYYGIQVSYAKLIIDSGKFTTSKFTLSNGGSVELHGGEYVIPAAYVETLKGFVATGSTVIINDVSYTAA